MYAAPHRLLRNGKSWLWRGLRRRRVPHALVLMYHRVAQVTVDPWQICVHPERFDDQIAALRRFADILPLATVPGAMRSGRGSRPALAITFDDGYVDNLTTAKPVLDRHRAPATVFLATSCIERGESFWWDVLSDAILGPGPLPGELRLDGGEQPFLWRDAAIERPEQAPGPARRRLLDALWLWLVRLPDPERRVAIRSLAQWAGQSATRDSSAQPMSPQQVRNLLAGGLITVGAHTATHARLTDLGRDEKLAEIERSRIACEHFTGGRPACFAYPFGELDDESRDCVRQAGFTVACTSEPGLAWADGDALRLPRLAVGDWSGKHLVRLLKWYWFA